MFSRLESSLPIDFNFHLCLFQSLRNQYNRQCPICYLPKLSIALNCHTQFFIFTEAAAAATHTDVARL